MTREVTLMVIMLSVLVASLVAHAANAPDYTYVVIPLCGIVAVLANARRRRSV